MKLIYSLLERDDRHFGWTVGETYYFRVHSSIPTVDVEKSFASEGKWLQVCTASNTSTQ